MLESVLILDAGREKTSISEGAKPHIVVLRGPSFGDVYELEAASPDKEALILGSDPLRADVVVRDVEVEPRHAKIYHEPYTGGYILKDLGTGEATVVNDEVIDGERTLACGDRIFLGNSVLEFIADDPIRKHFHRQMQHLINWDHLTGLLAKNRFDEEFEHALEAASEHKLPLSVLMADVDNLKQINDSYGHLLGEFAVGEIGRIIRELGETGERHATRFGGDEYQILLPGFTKDEALKVAEEIRRKVEDYIFERDGVHANLTLSIGVASYPEDGATTDALTKAADDALYRAKDLGGNAVSK